ncbi:ADP-heptose--lipooligosaccharide heptosyltransferase II, partial [uncultured Leptolyngbya sp.]
ANCSPRPRWNWRSTSIFSNPGRS